MAAGLGPAPAIVVLEPDALPHAAELPGDARAGRLALLRLAADTLPARPGARVYVDAGNPGWLTPEAAAGLLAAAGVGAPGSAVRGFSVNVSNFVRTDRCVEWGQAVLAALRAGGAVRTVGFVVDTSRNGNGRWTPGLAEPGAHETRCNPPGRALGLDPRLRPGPEGVDAYLWIKRPGESDGPCRGGPPAGAWWPDYALELVRNRGNEAGHQPSRGPPIRISMISRATARSEVAKPRQVA